MYHCLPWFYSHYNRKVTCKVNGEVAEEKEITLPGLSSDTVFFNLSFEEAGKQLIDINDQLGSIIVKGAVPPTDQTPLPADDNEPSTPTGEIAEVTEPNNTDNTNTGSSWPIAVGVIGGCLVIAVILVMVMRRRRPDTSENPPDNT